MPIIPAILVPTYQKLKEQLKKVEPFFNYVQLDIMDGEFVKNKSFNYNENHNLNEFFNEEINTKLRYELHLMVKNPLDEIIKWQKVKSVFRAIFHIESEDNPNEVIAKINGNCWQAGIAINPETPIEKIIPFTNKVKMILFMTVTPGRQGNKFLPEVGEKIKNFIRRLLTTHHPQGASTYPIIAVDGGIDINNISLAKSWGVEIFNVGHALMDANDTKEEYKKILAKIQI